MNSKMKKTYKRKTKPEPVVDNPTTEESEDDSSINEEDIFNVVNGEDADSSDSDREIDASDEEDDEILPEDAFDSESENSDEEGSDEEESDDEAAEDESDEDDDSGEDDEDTSDNEESSENEANNETKIAAEATKLNKATTSSKSRTVVEVPVVKQKKDEYDDHDTSDEEDIRNTVGNIPMNWYDDYKHLGYDWDGKKIAKPESGDQMDAFLKRLDDPEFWRTVKDPQTGKSVVLSDEDIELIKRIKGQKVPDGTFDDYAPWIEWFTSEVMEMPVRKFPEHKRSFLPSKTEAKKVSKLVHALKMGWIKTRAEAEKLRAQKDPQYYMLWSTDDQAEDMRRIHNLRAPPKRHLPGHAESYNPPPEYLFDEREMKKWEKQKNEPLKRKLHFVPQKYDSLRKVPAYPRFIKERFLRCLDLYLCPRGIKMKLNIDPESLVPKLPSPKDLQPFPNEFALVYKGHSDMVRSISTDKSALYLLSGSDDCTIKIWEVATGRCLRTVHTDGVVRSVEWCPNAALSLVLVAAGNQVLLINPLVGDPLVVSKTDDVLKEAPAQSDVVVGERVRTAVQWTDPDEAQYDRGYRIVLKHFKEVTQVTWHAKGDYFATVMPDGLNRSVMISQISRRRSQLPFSKSKGLVQCVLFHPTKPFLFVATQRHVRIYDLVKQTLMKKLLTNSRWVSSMAVHPLGDNLLVGTYDRKMLWFDLDLSTKPYQTLRLHGTAVRSVAFHKRYPLFASGSDDNNLIVSHGMVYNDLLKNPLLVPLKRIQEHQKANDFGIFAVLFHPSQPWVFSAGADGTIRLYSNY